MRLSENGFYCGDCGKFVYKGYDVRDKCNLPRGAAVCTDCGENYEDRRPTTSETGHPIAKFFHRLK